MRRKILFALVLTIALTLVACGGMKETPEQAVTNALTAVKNLDKETAQKYFMYDDLMSNSKNKVFNDEDEENLKLIMDKFDFKILSVTEKDDTAIAKTEITNINFEPIVGEYLKQAMAIAISNAFSDQTELNEERMEQIFLDLLKKEDNEVITSTVEIKLTKNKNETGWVLDMDEKLQGAILGGLTNIGVSSGEKDPENKLKEVANYVVGDIWNNGFCDISHFLGDGKNSIGQTMDIDFTLEQLDDAIGRKAQYDTFISNLEGEKYDKVKSIWNKLSPEIDKLYSKIKEVKPTANNNSYDFDTGLFNQYLDAFSKEISKLE